MDQTSDAGAEMVAEAQVGRMVDSRGTRGVVGPFGGGHAEGTLVMFEFRRTPRIMTPLDRRIMQVFPQLTYMDSNVRERVSGGCTSAFNDDVRYMYMPKQEGHIFGR
jgi:hypothetical protein